MARCNVISFDAHAIWSRQLRHNRLSAEAPAYEADESKVHERDEIYFSFCMFVDCLSPWQRRLLFHSATRSNGACLCVDVLCCFISFSNAYMLRQHQLPQHQHWACHARNIDTHAQSQYRKTERDFRTHFTPTAIRIFRQLLAVASSCWSLSFCDSDGFFSSCENWFCFSHSFDD